MQVGIFEQFQRTVKHEIEYKPLQTRTWLDPVLVW